MALQTLSSAQSSSIGIWAEVTTNANLVVTNGTTATSLQFALPITGSGSLFNINLPIAVNILNQSGIQGAANSGLPAGLGLTNCVMTNATTITLNFVNNSAANININTNTRIILQQANGI